MKIGSALLFSGLFFFHTILIYFISTPVLADARKNLQTRLSQVESFYATFSHKIINSEGDIIQEALGEFWIKRPNLFNWHIIFPEKSFLISDGKTIWFYTPFIQQATAIWLKDAIDNIPFILMIRNNLNYWMQYNIKQKNDYFELIPKKSKGNLEKITTSINRRGIIKNLTLTEKSGQLSIYHFKDQKNTEINICKFNFTLPQEVTLDDQRQ